MHRGTQKRADLPPCASCLKPAELFDAWGHMLCADCTDAWLASPERKEATKALYPMPLWEMHRLRQEGKPAPELPDEAAIETAHRHGAGLWLERRKRDRLPRVVR